MPVIIALRYISGTKCITIVYLFIDCIWIAFTELKKNQEISLKRITPQDNSPWIHTSMTLTWPWHDLDHVWYPVKITTIVFHENQMIHTPMTLKWPWSFLESNGNYNPEASYQSKNPYNNDLQKPCVCITYETFSLNLISSKNKEAYIIWNQVLFGN